MGKNKTETFLCTDCGNSFLRWSGKCPDCGAFNTIKSFHASEISNETLPQGQDLVESIPFKKQPQANTAQRIKTRMSEVDRVLGDGFFPGSVILFGGQPGIGKSTLALQIFSVILEAHAAFYFSGEESPSQVLDRGERINQKKSEKIKKNLFATNSLEDIVETIQKNSPEFVVIDSIQMIGSQSVNFGSMSQIRENAEVLVKLAKSTHATILIIGHVTKSEEIAGPKLLEHLVDTVLYLEGEKNSEIRLLRSTKNRFGSTLEVGIFGMDASGLKPLENPSEYFLSERAQNASGNAICAIRDGVRNFLLEIQTLTLKSNFGNPRRTSSGINLARFHLLLAVISKFTPFSCHEHDAYLNIVGGLTVQDTAADLAICATILSARADREIPADTVIFGEVGLSGEIRRVSNIESRIAEIKKLGFKKVICPPLSLPKKTEKNIFQDKNFEVIEIKSIQQLTKIILGTL